LNLAESKQIAVELALEACPVHADPNLLKIVLNNLIGNAIQHHPGNGSVWLQCRLLNQQIELTVRDDGPGISDEDLPRIFDRFFRADKVRGSQDSHSGLGLALVKAILQRMASEITVQSRIGTGTTFTVSIPVRSPSPEA
jgi:signal transduction histidine kinase